MKKKRRGCELQITFDPHITESLVRASIRKQNYLGGGPGVSSQPLPQDQQSSSGVGVSRTSPLSHFWRRINLWKKKTQPGSG